MIELILICCAFALVLVLYQLLSQESRNPSKRVVGVMPLAAAGALVVGLVWFLQSGGIDIPDWALNESGHPRLWTYSLTVSLVAGLLSVIGPSTWRNETVQGIAWFFGIMSVSAYVIPLIGNTGEKTIRYSSCPDRPFDRNFTVSEEKSLAFLEGNTFYNIDVPDDRVRDFRITFADEPVPDQPSMQISNVYEYVSVFYPGDSNRLAAGMSRGFVRVRTDTEKNKRAYRAAINSYDCLAYYVYLAPR